MTPIAVFSAVASRFHEVSTAASRFRGAYRAFFLCRRRSMLPFGVRLVGQQRRANAVKLITTEENQINGRIKKNCDLK
jgi:hypothetical protein